MVHISSRAAVLPMLAPYWFQPSIHSLGNTGPMGLVHAMVGPFCTKCIDVNAYDGRNIRFDVLDTCKDLQTDPPKRIADLACGVGCSSRSLKRKFRGADVVALDTSREMLSVAKWWPTFDGDVSVEYLNANAEDTGLESGTFDLVTAMFVMHEAPGDGRRRILQEAKRLLKPGGKCLVFDLAPTYKPRKEMLAGEPYLIDYTKNIQQDVHLSGFSKIEKVVLREHHATAWWCYR